MIRKKQKKFGGGNGDDEGEERRKKRGLEVIDESIEGCKCINGSDEEHKCLF